MICALAASFAISRASVSATMTAEVKTMNMNAEGIGIARLGQIQIRAHDVDRAANFYQNVLGLGLLFKAPPGLAFFDCGGVRLLLDSPKEPEFDHPSSILYFAVPDIQAAFAKMKEKGVKFEDEPHVIAKMPDHDLWMTFFHDSEGNMLALMSAVTR
jgi:methylmalonyl-CoA/ethylmalonyl-CoA epimerase